MPLDFPSSPTNGQVYGNYYYNSTRGAWNALLPAATPTFLTSATLNYPTLIDALATSSLISTTPLTVKGIAGQTANLQEWKNDSGTTVAALTPLGAFVGYGANLMQSLVTTRTPLTVKGSSGQIANLQEWHNSGGTVLSSISSSGTLTVPSVVASTSITTTADLATTVPLVVKAAASQTANIQQWQSSTGAVLSSINSSGDIQVPRIGVGSVMPITTRLFSTAGAATEIPIAVRGAASQSVSLQQWQNSAGTTLAEIASNGTFFSSANIETSGRVIGTTQPNDGSTGGLAIKAPASGTQTSAYLQFVNNAYNAQYGSIGADPNGVITINAKVSMPQQPTYSGTLQYATNGANYYPVAYDSFNVGFSRSGNNRLTVPTAGKYYVYAHQLVNTINVSCYFQIFKNGGVITHAYSNNDDTYDLIVAALIDCAANDYIELYYGGSNTYTWGDNHSRYSVFKVS